MSEVVTAIVAAISALIGVGLRELTHRRQRSQKIAAQAVKIAAETTVEEATAAETISETVKGLLIVMRDQLEAAQGESKLTREELVKTQAEVRQLRSDLDAEKELTKRLTAEMSDLTARLTAAEQENP